MTDIEALRESERRLEELRRYRIAADDPGRFDQPVDAALLAVREKLARLAAPAPDVEGVIALATRLFAISFEDGVKAEAGIDTDGEPEEVLVKLEAAIRALAGTPPAAITFDATELQNALVMLKGPDGRYVFGDGGGLDETMDAIRPFLRPALTEALRPYLQHFEECNALVREDERAECDCGFAELMREAFGEVTP